MHFSFSHLIPPNGLSVWKLNPASSGVRCANQKRRLPRKRSPHFSGCTERLYQVRARPRKAR